ncbi:NlpC/P60 family protein [Roseovarius pacificus]|uniref:C40 family peptidase n=1 Tax=Roseovarius pacificus TaxID=337701 RepID=UPI002A18AF60|nr:NlpC/P60 family protein [Roseovarius pacificus]
MSDPRLTPANPRVAHVSLRGQVTADRFTEGDARQVTVPVADLLHAPGGRRERQLLMGDGVTCLEDRNGWAFVQAARDGFVGYLRNDQLGQDEDPPTHRVTARATHLYPTPDFRSHELAMLSHGARLAVLGQEGRFAETPQGYVPAPHLTPLDMLADDPVAVADLFLGTPYLWGGNSALGIDCSGLVQAGCLACGIACPGDSDLQETALGTDLSEDAPLQRGDLLFWKGHVAWVADPDTLLHANAFHMAVVHEPLTQAIPRIAAQGDGPVTARKRLKG